MLILDAREGVLCLA